MACERSGPRILRNATLIQNRHKTRDVYDVLKNKQERHARYLADTLNMFRRDYGGAAVLIHAKLQILLTHGNLNLSNDAEQLIRSAYEMSQALQNLIKEKLPAPE